VRFVVRVRCELACAINADLESARLFRERSVPSRDTPTYFTH
jgi:hypothetical protein